jgi:TolA-binding protein
MKSKLPALLAAFLITAVIALSMAVVGVNALVNPNSTSVSNSPVASAAAVTTGVSADQATVGQLQTLISQYQQHEQQYQQREQQYQQQIQQDQQQIQQDQTQLQQAADQAAQIQQLLVTLQDRGLIQVDQNGQITILRRGTTH